MKKLLFIFLASLVIISCQKKIENINLTTDVVFGISEVNSSRGLKSTDPPDCPTDEQGNLLEPTYAKITITDGSTTTTYTPEVFRLDGKLYTQVINLQAQQTGSITYMVTDFLLYDVNDVLIMATPTIGAVYSEYVSKSVEFGFDVNAFEKADVAVEVLCYLPENHEYFGFAWFEITEIVVREFCFFGDICLDGNPFMPAEFNGSLYGSSLGIDVPAIMYIDVFNDGDRVPNAPFYNLIDDVLTSPLCVQYPDKLNVDGEVFTFELWILLPDATAASGWSYQLHYTFTSTDDGALDIDGGTDGIVEFVFGTCNYSSTDLQLPLP